MTQLTSGARRWAGLLLAALATAASLRAAETQPPADQKTVQDGIAVAGKVEPVDGGPGPILEGRNARVTPEITDKLTAHPLTALYPGAWMDRPASHRQPPPADCHKKVEAFIGG